jgi:hypothetical protein
MIMNTRKEKYREWRKIDGEDILVKNMLTMEYDGTWRSDGWDVVGNGKEVYFIGYPTDKDIRNRLKLTNRRK